MAWKDILILLFILFSTFGPFILWCVHLYRYVNGYPAKFKPLFISWLVAVFYLFSISTQYYYLLSELFPPRKDDFVFLVKFLFCITSASLFLMSIFFIVLVSKNNKGIERWRIKSLREKD